ILRAGRKDRNRRSAGGPVQLASHRANTLLEERGEDPVRGHRDRMEVRIEMTLRRPILAALAIGFCAALTARAADRGSLTLADALQVIQSKELVDLTHRFSPSTPVWGGFGQATMTAACDPKTYRPYTIEKDGFR